MEKEDHWYVWNEVSGTGNWQYWKTDEHFNRLCEFPKWREIMREHLWLATEQRIRNDREVTPAQLQALGFGKEVVDQRVYDLAFREFVTEYSISDVSLSKYEKSLFAWGLEMGLPL